MRILSFIVLAGASLFIFSCTNFDEADSSSRSTSIHLYEGPLSLTASDFIQEENGYVMLASMTDEVGGQVAVVFKTDLQGNRVGDFEYFTGMNGKAIKSFSNSDFTGYLILGDSIKIEPNASEVADIEVSSAKLLMLNSNLSRYDSLSFKDTTNVSGKTDIKAASLTVKEDGGIVLLVTYKGVNQTEKPWIISFDQDFELEWHYPFNGLVRDYISSKSIHHYNTNQTITASSWLRQQGNFNEKYVSIVKIEDYLSESNYALLGEALNKSIAANDIQPEALGAGFGVVGTSSETDGTGKNLFFVKLNNAGSIGQDPDTLFIDALLSRTDIGTSRIEDTGETLSACREGGFILAGTMLTTSVSGGETVGNGARDILLVRLDFGQNILWTKILGGTGDEIVSTIHEGRNGELLIYGTNTVGGYSSTFLMITDQHGELKK